MTTSTVPAINPEQYHEYSSVQEKWAHEMLEKIPFQGDENILDIGCGNGRITHYLAEKVQSGGKVIGSDISPSMIEFAKHTYENKPPHNLDFLVLDARHLTKIGAFDLVVSFSCFHWFDKHDQVVQQISQNLKPNGFFCAVFCPNYGVNPINQAIDAVASQDKWRPYFKTIEENYKLTKPDDFLLYLKQAGLVVEHFEIREKDEMFEDENAYMNWMIPWLGGLHRFPEDPHFKEQLQEFANEILTNYLSLCPLDEQGHVHYLDYTLEVLARKIAH